MKQEGCSKQIFDDLTSHIALFHASSRPPSSNPNPRKAILRWFSSLSPPQRQASLTVVDSEFLKILLQMIVRLQTEGLCHFFVLPDLPAAPGSKLPSLCHRQLDGLLSRASSSSSIERLISRSIRLFGSRDGERGTEYDLDSMSVSEDFVKDAEKFVTAMDEISNGEFLRELDPSTCQSAWVELQWLQAKGYYSLESFISNKLELALRKSWLEYNGGKKPRSGKSSGKISAAGIAASAFWRQKGCLDWWLGLDPGVRKKVYVGFLCKGAKSLVKEIIERRFSDMKDELAPIWIQSKPVSCCTSVSPFQRMSQLCCSLDPNFFFGFDSASSSRKPSPLANQLNLLLILREISEKLLRLSNSQWEIESIFFSELGSVADVSDWTLRRLRWSLMSMWKECMKIELMGDPKLDNPQTPTEEGSCKAKKKSRNLRRMNSSMKASKGNGNPTKDKENSKFKIRSRENPTAPDLSTSVREEIVKKESLKPQNEMENAVADQRVNPVKPNGGRRRSRFKASKVMEVDAPLGNEILRQPRSSAVVLSETLSSKEEAGKVSCREVVGKCKPFQSEDDLDLKNLKKLAYSVPPTVSIHLPHHSSAAGILHLDSNHSEKFLYPINVDASNKTGSRQIIPPRVLPMSFDWPLMVRSLGRLNFDTLCSAVKTKNEGELKSTLEGLDDSEGYWVSEDESDSHTLSGRDYNKLFGGGVMYWNTSDHVSTGFPQAPSYSSEDSSWAWHEADLNRAIDDMVSYVMPGNEAPEEKAGCSEGPKGDLHSYPVLRPIIIPNISRKGSRSEFKINPEHTSPNVGSARGNFPRIKRPLSPVVLCVPRGSRSALPCVGESRKHRGFPVVRSGSSSPRSWGMRNCQLEENASPGTHMCLNRGEIIWASWENGEHAGSPFMQPVPGPLLQDRLIAISHRDLEHPDIGLPVQAMEPSCPSHKERLSTMHNLLHEEIDFFCKKVAAENQIRKPYINCAVKRVTKSLQVLWPRSRTSVFGSNATGLALPSSDVDLVVCLPPVRNLEPIKEAGILEGRNGIKETCLQHAARYLANQDWVKNDSLKTIENTAIPLIMLVAEVPRDIIDVPQRRDSSDPKESSVPNLVQPLPRKNTLAQSVRLDISFRSSTHTGLQTMELVRHLTEQFPASIPLALVLKQFLADRNLDRSYSGGLSSYCLVLLIIRFLQHEHHLGRSNSQNLGSLLMDFLYFFGNVFDPRQMHVSIQGSGTYMKRDRGHSIDPIHIDDPLCMTNNVGKNCFRIHQCIKAFADAYSTIDRQLSSLSVGGDSKSHVPFRFLRKIIPGIEGEYG